MIAKQRCTHCIRTLETPRELAQGRCSDCETNTLHFADRKWSALASEFADRLQSYRDRGGRYDCLVPLSGGKDSTYVLYYLTQVQKVRGYAYSYSNFFQRPEADTNIHKAVRAAATPLFVYDPFAPAEWRRAYRALMSNWGHPCLFCYHLRTPMIYNVCLEHKIPLVVYGADHTQAELLPMFSSNWQLGVDERFAIHQAHAATLAKDLETSFQDEPELLEKFYSGVPYFQAFVAGEVAPADLPAFVSLGQYHNWRLAGEDHFIRVLKDFCDYVPVGHTKENTNCSLERLRVYVESQRGDSYPVQVLSRKIREREIDRDSALQTLQTYQVAGDDLDRTIQEFCDKVEIAPHTLAQYLTKHAAAS